MGRLCIYDVSVLAAGIAFGLVVREHNKHIAISLRMSVKVSVLSLVLIPILCVATQRT